MASLSFFARPALAPGARIEKRPASRSVVLTSEPRHKKIKVAKQQKEVVDVRHRQLMTPQPSSDAPEPPSDASDEHHYRVLPRHRLMTPSTSTVAASSSPRRMSSPPAHHNHRTIQPSHAVMLTEDAHLLFGRHRERAHRPATLPLPATLKQYVECPGRIARHVILDRSARHASRQHALVELAGERVRIVVLGQNGMRVRTASGVTRLARGSVAEYDVGADLTLDFYGAAVALKTNERLFTPEPEPEEVRSRDSPLSLPPSSPPVMGMDLDDEELSEPEDEPLSPPSPVSRPLSPPPALVEVKQEMLEKPASRASTPKPTKAATPKPATPKVSKSRAATPAVEVPPLPAGLDLPALLASTVVFSGSSKLSLPDLVRSLLEYQPSMRDHGDESTWALWAGAELESNSMFGKVSRNGKDSSGHPLLPHYFYNPANDPDAARAKELGGLVRPLRAAQRAGGKAIDWRPVGRGRRL